MSETAIPASIVARVKKLLALAGNNSNEHEASAAAEKAQALMAEYNLELAEGGETGAAETDRAKADPRLEARREWQVTIMRNLAANNFCMHWTVERRDVNASGKGKVRNRTWHMLIGRKANVEVTVSMYGYLTDAMARLNPYQDGRDRSHISWFAGCADRLASRLGTLRREAEAASRARRGETPRGSGNDLVLSDVYSSEDDLNNDMRYGYDPGTTARARAEYEAQFSARAAARHASPPVPVVVKPETPAERVRREREEARAEERSRRYWQKIEAKTDRHAYGQGSEAGRDIGLDPQVRGAGAAGRIG